MSSGQKRLKRAFEKTRSTTTALPLPGVATAYGQDDISMMEPDDDDDDDDDVLIMGMDGASENSQQQDTVLTTDTATDTTTTTIDTGVSTSFTAPIANEVIMFDRIMQKNVRN